MLTPHAASFENEKRHAIEKRVLRNEIKFWERHSAESGKLGIELRKKQYNDSVKYSVLLIAKDKQIKTLQKRINEINTSRFTSRQLDSLVSILYPDWYNLHIKNQ